MRFFRKIAGILGFAKDDGHEVKDEEDDDAHRDNDNDVDERSGNRVNMQQTGLPRKGFGVPVQVAIERASVGPVLVPCSAGDGSVQGLRWYAKQLRIDEDGDVADEFLNEVLPETSSSEDNHSKPPAFEVKYSARPAKVKQQKLALDGKIQHHVEHHGRIQWV